MPEHVHLSWAARPTRELASLAWPIAVSMLSYAVMTLVDTLFVGGLGPAALAGVGLGGTAAFMVMVFPFGLLRGVKVLVSQAVGAGRAHEASGYVAAGFGWALVLGALGLVLRAPIAELLPYIAASPESGEAARRYASVRLFGAPMVMLYAALREGRYGLGDVRSPMVTALVANVVNIALDYLLLVRLGRGVEGAAWASVVANGVTCALLAMRQHREGWGRITLRGLRQVWRVGVPTGAQFVLEMGSFGLLAAMLAALAETEMAAHQIAIQVIHFTFLPPLAVSEAASVLAGQAVGARRRGLVPGVARRALALGGAYALFCTVVLFALAGPIAGAFTDDGELLARARQLLYVAALFQIADAANVAARGVLRGAGDVRYPAMVGIVTAWVFTPPLTYLLGYQLGLGALGGWLGLTLEIVFGAALLWRRLLGTGWHAAAERTRVETSDDPEWAPA